MNIQQEVSHMLRLPWAQLCSRYVEILGEAPRCSNRMQLVRRMAWRLQAREEGDLSERARRKAEELANDADLRLGPPTNGRKHNRSMIPSVKSALAGSSGLPMPGAVLSRLYKGRHIEVVVLADGFEYQGTHYRSLSAIAKAVTGTHWNGRLFFGLKSASRREVKE